MNNTVNDEWEVLIKPAKRAKVGTEISFGDGRLKAVVKEELDHGGRIIDFILNFFGLFMRVVDFSIY